MNSFLAFLFVLGVLVFVHELGHFLMARRHGVRVLTFSLGFGPKVLKVVRGDTEYCISIIPLGGYVKMAGETPDDPRSGAPDEFLSKTKWQRFQILIMGPVMNIVLALVVMTAVLYNGAAGAGLRAAAAGDRHGAGRLAGREVRPEDGRPGPVRRWHSGRDLAALLPAGDAEGREGGRARDRSRRRSGRPSTSCRRRRRASRWATSACCRRCTRRSRTVNPGSTGREGRAEDRRRDPGGQGARDHARSLAGEDHQREPVGAARPCR